MNQQMYIGPTIPGVVKKGTVFIGGLPKGLDDAKRDVPAIGNLVVPIGEATKATQALKEQGSVEHVSYRKVLSYLEGGERNAF